MLLVGCYLVISVVTKVKEKEPTSPQDILKNVNVSKTTLDFHCMDKKLFFKSVFFCVPNAYRFRMT